MATTFHRPRHCLFLFVAAAMPIAWLFGAGRAAAQDTQPAAVPPRAPMQAGEQIVELNRALRIYASGTTDPEQRNEAKSIFAALGSRSGEHQRTGLYYLGLMNLEDGLAGANATRDLRDRAEELLAEQQSADPERARAIQVELEEISPRRLEAASAARAAFVEARRNFEQLGQLITDGLQSEPTRAGLLLGIAQLADEFERGEAIAVEEKPFELAKQAADTLRQYLATGEGATDRYGHFYYAIANYRLADEYHKRKDYVAQSMCLRNADRELAVSMELTKSAEGLSPEQVRSAERTVLYYRALLDIQAGQNASARARLVEVIRSGAPDRPDFTLQREQSDLPIVWQAKQIVEKLDKSAVTSPPPISINVPRPIGPLEFDGRISVANGFDTNVILLGKDTALPLTVSRSDDYFVGIEFEANISRFIPSRELGGFGQSLTIGVGGTTAHQWQPNIPQYDVNRYGGRAFLSWEAIPDLYIGLNYDFNHTLLGHDPFITSNRLVPSVTAIWRGEDRAGESRPESGRTQAYFVWEERNYFDRIPDTRLNRDGEYHVLGLRHTFNLIKASSLPYMTGYFASRPKDQLLFGDKYLSFTIGYDYRNDRTRGREFDMHAHGFGAGLFIPLPYRFALEILGKFSWEDYTEQSIYDYERKNRFDFVQQYEFGLTNTLVARGEDRSIPTLEVKVRGGISLTIEDSNIWDRFGQDVYEYNRQLFGVGIEVRF